MTSKVFITGISGFIGRAVAERLGAMGMEVGGLSRQGGQPGIISADILDCSRYKGEIGSADIVIHLAAPTTAAEINGEPLAAMRANLIGTHGMLEAFSAGRGAHFIYFSSGKVYGRQKRLPFTEDLQTDPNTALGQSKKAAEQLVEFYAQHTGRCYSIVRLFNAYGPGQRPGFLIPTILEQLGKTEIKLGDTRGKRDFIYITDVVKAIELLVTGRQDGCEIYNVGSSVSHSPADLISILEKLTKRDIRVSVDPSRLRSGEPDEERAGISKMEALGWVPEVDMRLGLKSILEATHATVT